MQGLDLEMAQTMVQPAGEATPWSLGLGWGQALGHPKLESFL